MKKLLALILAAAGMLLGPNVARADIIIDNFNDSPSVTFFVSGATGIGSTILGPNAPAVVLGGEREVQITMTPNAGTNGGRITIGDPFATGTTSTDTNYTGLYEFFYDGVGINNLNADLSKGLSFELEARADLANVEGEIVVFDGVTSDTVGFKIAQGGALQPISIPFGAFSGIDFSNIESITLRVNTSGIQEADVEIDNFRIPEFIIPEPASLVLLTGALFGAGGLHILRRRRGVK